MFLSITQFSGHNFIKKTYRRYIFILLTVVGFQSFSNAQQEEVKEPILALFNGMRKNDSALIKSAFAPDAIMQTITRNKEGMAIVRNEEVQEFITAITKPHKEVYDERITFDVIKTDGDLAIVWTPYQFYVDNQFSHCGVDSFQLVRINGKWKIQYLIDTRRKQPCP